MSAPELGADMQRREFISLLGGAAVGWPLAARAQRPTKILSVGTVAGTPKSSPQWVAFERRMSELGYQEGRNFSFDFLQAASADEYEVLYQKLAARTRRHPCHWPGNRPKVGARHYADAADRDDCYRL
jgi:hypothetical protein